MKFIDNNVSQKFGFQKDYLFRFFLFVFAIVCLIHILQTWDFYNKFEENNAIEISRSVAPFISSEINNLSEDPGNIFYNQHFMSISSVLFKLQKSIAMVNHITLFKIIDNNLLIIADSNSNINQIDSTSEKWNQIIAGNAYETMQSGKTFITRKSFNSDDKMISTLYPIKDMQNDKIIAILGINFSAQKWESEIFKHVIHIILLDSSLIITISLLYWIYKKNQLMKNMSRKLLKSETLFRTLFEQSPLGIAILHEDHPSSLCNSTYERILALSSEDSLKFDWFSMTQVEDRQVDQAIYIRNTTSTTAFYTKETSYTRPDGQQSWVFVTMSRLIFKEESKTCHVCIVSDISERKKTEDQLIESERSKSVILSHLPGLAYRCDFDPDWTMHYLSDGCISLTGYKPNELINNTRLSYREVICQEYQDLIWNEWKRVISCKENFSYEYEIITANGDRKWVLERGQGIYNEADEVEALEGLVIDITEQKIRDKQIQYLNERDLLTGVYNRKYYEDAKYHLNEKSLPISIIIGDINGLRLINDAFGHNKGNQIIKETATLIRNCCRPNDILARTGGGEFRILMSKTDLVEANQILDEIYNKVADHNARHSGTVNQISLSLGYGVKIDTGETLSNAERDAETFMSNRKILEQNSHHNEMLSTIMATMYARSQETEQHAERIAKLCLEIGELLQLSQKGLDELRLFAMLHDIGKIGIDDHILNKPGKLTSDEWSIMKRHPIIGSNIAQTSKELSPISEFILSHHERWDGKGYPRGLKGTDIPLLARILAVADTFDAMTESRIYRVALPLEDAINEILKNSGTQFDPLIVEKFTEVACRKYEINQFSTVLR